MKKLIKSLFVIGFLGASFTINAQVDVVKIMSLSCKFCYSAETFDPFIESTVIQGGGRFVYAPVPSNPEDNGEKEMVYYGARDLNSRYGDIVKKSMYKAIQDIGVPLTNYSTIYTWLQKDTGLDDGTLSDIIKKGSQNSSRDALSRAVGLATSGGVSMLPTYIILKDNRIVQVIDSSSSSKNNLSSLREDVINYVKSLNSTNK